MVFNRLTAPSSDTLYTSPSTNSSFTPTATPRSASKVSI